MSASGDPPEPERKKRKRLRRARQRRPIRARFDLRKAMFVLPNLFTVSSIFCGYYAIVLCMDTPGPLEIRRAGLAIFFGMFFDMFDGRVARLTRTQSEFGMQLDSLADVVSFGAAPGVLLWRWALHDLDGIGLVACFLYVACGALRLARFNVLAARDPGGGGGKHFVGLPIPLAAGAVVASVLATYPYDRTADGGLIIALADGSSQLAMPIHFVLAETLLLALLMVSNVRYPTFKKVRPSKRSLSIAFTVVLTFAIVAILSKPAVALAVLFVIYIAAGIFEHTIALARPPVVEPEPPAPPPTQEETAPKSP
jgi:CDP-diacylglycerol---serine O-phosphatidyltransferase